MAQLGSASALGAEGRWFKSSYPDFFASVAELVDALDLGSSGVTHESSSLSSCIAPLAQW